MSLTSLLITTITVQQQTTSQDSSGGATRTWANVTGSVNVKADIQPASGQLRRRYEQRQLFVTHTIYTAADIAVKPNMRITSGARTFIVLGYENPIRPGQPFVTHV